MKSLNASVSPYGAAMFLAVLAGCNGAQSLAPSSSAVANASTSYQKGSQHSWMSPDAKKAKSLLYVPDFGEFQVVVYAWPNPTKPIGTLTEYQFYFPSGACADTSGHVYITDSGANFIVEYKSGATVPMRTLSDPGISPVACSVDPKTGNLAVANFGTSAGGNGTVSIYSAAKGTPKTYTDDVIWNVRSLSYDGGGTLWLDGNPSEPGFLYASLDPATGKFQNEELKGATLEGPGGMSYDGKHVTVGDAGNAVVYQTDGFKIIGKIPLTYAEIGYTIQDGILVGPAPGSADVYLYNYPSGGAPLKTLSGDLGEPYSAAITNNTSN
jgi:hypothetical protein